MAKRIMAVLLILAMLLSMGPVIVSAEEEYVYQIGDDIWIVAESSDTEPTEPTVEDGRWEKVPLPDGSHETRPSCHLEIHEDHDYECYDAKLNLICGKPIHTAKRHNNYCVKLRPEYHWVVELDPEYVPPVVTPPEGGEGEGGGVIGSDGSGKDDRKGLINFTVTNRDPDEKPIAGSKFGLFAWDGDNYAYLENQNVKEEQQQKIEEQNLEQQEKIKELQEAGDQKALEEYLQQANLQNEELVAEMNESDNALLAKTTNEEGKAYFRSLENYLEKKDEKDTWKFRLVQADVSETYKANNQPVEIEIKKTGVETYDLFVGGKLYTEEDENADGFIFENVIEEYKLLVAIQFSDLEGNVIAGEALDDVTASIDVINESATEESDRVIPVSFPTEEDVVVESQKWKKTLQVLPGKFTAGNLQVSDTIAGYTFKSCQWEFVPPNDYTGTNVSDEYATLGKLNGADLTGVNLNIKAYYEKNAEPEPEETTQATEQPPEPPKPVIYTIIVESVDQDTGEALTGTRFSLDADGIKAENIGSEWRYTINAGICAPGNYTLEETVEPKGYNRCEDIYTITVKEDGDVILSKGNFIQRLFTRTNLAELGGTERVTFQHTRKTAAIRIMSTVDAAVERLCWDGQNTKAEFENKEHGFILRWKAADGTWQEEKLSVGNQEKAFQRSLPYGTEYEVIPEDDSWYTYILSDNHKGKVTAADTDHGILLTAEIFYKIVHGDDLDLYFTKVDSQTKEGLAGAKFTLTDSNGQELQRYTTKKGGAIDVEDIIDWPGKYLLKETKAPEEYDVLRRPVEIYVAVAYRPVSRGGETVVEQYLYEDVVHRSVTMGTDGTYWIKNTASGDNPKTGDCFDLRLWTSVLVVSMAGLAVTALEIQRKKRIRK